jgi:hypothetical protein
MTSHHVISNHHWLNILPLLRGRLSNVAVVTLRLVSGREFELAIRDETSTLLQRERRLWHLSELSRDRIQVWIEVSKPHDPSFRSTLSWRQFPSGIPPPGACCNLSKSVSHASRKYYSYIKLN